jgi:hypothetical protein
MQRGNKITKCPFNARTGALADSTGPGTWSTFEEAMAAWQGGAEYEGVGYVFSSGDPFCGVDLDDCIDAASGEMKPWGRRIVASLNSYSEISPSGAGVKIFIRASKSGDQCRKAHEDGEIEVYDAGRYFTVTGRRLEDVSADVEDRQKELNELYDVVFAKPIPRPPAPPAQTAVAEGAALTDDAIIKKARSSRKGGPKFSELWAGQWDKHFRSQSEADSSLVFTLAFYTKDAAQIDRIFRRSCLMRDKWDEPRGQTTYGQQTIAKALEMVTEQYQPRGRRQQAAATPPPSPGGLPQIVIHDVQLSALTAEGLAAMQKANQPPLVFVRSGSLSRVIRDEDGQPAVDKLDKVKVRARLADVANFYSITKNGNFVSANPPLHLAENILAQGTWDFPSLMGIARAPILRRDGTICTTQGYDGQSCLYYCPDPGLVVPPIPENPSPEEVEAARDTLVDLIIEFPFADSASLANAMAILLSILMRPVIAGHVPLAIVDAPVQGTGKTLMVTVLGIVAIGPVCGESIPDKQNADEWRKKITSVLLKGMPLVLLDNVPDNSTIDAPPSGGHADHPHLVRPHPGQERQCATPRPVGVGGHRQQRPGRGRHAPPLLQRPYGRQHGEAVDPDGIHARRHRGVRPGQPWTPPGRRLHLDPGVVRGGQAQGRRADLRQLPGVGRHNRRRAGPRRRRGLPDQPRPDPRRPGRGHAGVEGLLPGVVGSLPGRGGHRRRAGGTHPPHGHVRETDQGHHADAPARRTAGQQGPRRRVAEAIHRPQPVPPDRPHLRWAQAM